MYMYISIEVKLERDVQVYQVFDGIAMKGLFALGSISWAILFSEGITLAQHLKKRMLLRLKFSIIMLLKEHGV